MSKNQTVEQLRKSGYKIRITHSRNLFNYSFIGYPKAYNAKANDICPRGGITYIQLTTPEGKDITSVSKCNLSDNYNKKIGVAIALGRALKKLKNPQIGYIIGIDYASQDKESFSL